MGGPGGPGPPESLGGPLESSLFWLGGPPENLLFWLSLALGPPEPFFIIRPLGMGQERGPEADDVRQIDTT